MAADLVDGPSHELWEDATGSGASGNYFVAIKVGDDDFGPPDIDLSPGQFTAWAWLTDASERPVRTAPEVVRVL